MKSKMSKVAVVILNYNSKDDLFKCIGDIQKQKEVDIVTIVVDNASNTGIVKAVQEWSNENYPSSISGTPQEIIDIVSKEKKIGSLLFIYNNENRGYSAGNNIGIQVADKLDVDAVLIANPDMQFPDEKYVSKLAEVMMFKDEYFIVASKIIGLDGKDQSPLRESTFWEELLWPLQLLPKKLFNPRSYILPYEPNTIMEVPKVMGCSLLLRMSFLREIGYLDEKVFLYSEEPILSAQVKRLNGKIMFVPYVEAIHAHITSEKGNSSLRMLSFIKSRRYYIDTYSTYNFLQKVVLKTSYLLLSLLHKLKSKGKY